MGKPTNKRTKRSGRRTPPIQPPPPGGAEGVTMVPTANLRPHPRNGETYSARPSAELLQSIRDLGIQQPLVINDETRVIVSGHLRYSAAVTLGIIQVPALCRTYSDELAELEALVEHNRTRDKNEAEKGEELMLLLEVESARAKQRKVAGARAGKDRSKSTHPTDGQIDSDAETGKALEIAAKRVGWGYGKARQFLAIKRDAPHILDDIGRGKLSVNAAYKEMQLEKDLEDLLPDTPPNWPEDVPRDVEEVLYVPIDELHIEEDFSVRECSEPGDRMIASVRMCGVIYPLRARRKEGRLLIIDGERRYRAAIAASIAEIPVIIHGEVSDVSALVLHLIFNWDAPKPYTADESQAAAAELREAGLSAKEIAGLVRDFDDAKSVTMPRRR